VSATDPTRAERNEAAVRWFLDKLHDLAFPDLDAALEPFADDAEYWSLVPRRTPMRGKATIRRELGQQFTRYAECDCEIVALAASDRFVFTERRDHVTMLAFEKRIYSSVNAVFEFDDDGRIVSWREYWDALDIAGQLGLTPDEMRRLHGVE
jgi:limonene-1,2-epoxide hydrolase